MKNIHILPTDKPSRLRYFDSKLEIMWLIPKKSDIVFQNIYITSDEEIKQGDYGLSKLNEIIKFHSGYDYRYYAKIILTTDKDLDDVQVIDDEFLEWFIKNPSCEWVEVEDTCLEVRVCDCAMNENCLKPGYTIIIPQEEPKQETLEEAADNWVRKPVIGTKRESFIAGANWQAERMYSEEELLIAFEAGMMFIGEDKGSFGEWFNKFKKK